MIWAITGMGPPPPWVRLLANAGMVFICGSAMFLVSLVTMDREPPFEIISGAATPSPVRVGEIVEINWQLKELHYCPTIHSMRSLTSDVDPNWIHVIGELQPNLDPETPRPLARTATSQPVRIPRSTPFEPGQTRTTLYWTVDVRAACNWLLEMLPERWWIHFPLPRVPIEVVIAAPQAIPPR